MRRFYKCSFSFRCAEQNFVTASLRSHTGYILRPYQPSYLISVTSLVHSKFMKLLQMNFSQSSCCFFPSAPYIHILSSASYFQTPSVHRRSEAITARTVRKPVYGCTKTCSPVGLRFFIYIDLNVTDL